MKCPKCGNENKKNVKFCGKCGNKIITQENSGFSDTKKSNDSKKRWWLIVLIILMFIALLIVSIFCFVLKHPMTIQSVAGQSDSILSSTDATLEDTTSVTTKIDLGEKTITVGNSAVLCNGVDEYYIGGWGAFLLGDDNYVSRVKISSVLPDEDSFLRAIAMDKNVFDGKVLFAQEESTLNELYKFTFDSDDTVKKEVWIDEKTLLNSVVVKEKNNSNKKKYTGNMRYWQLDGDYIYFIYLPGVEYITTERNIAYRLGRITKDGSKIEFLNNEIASTYTVKDGWIYYYDNGYTYDKSKSQEYYYDFNRVGIYKMKSDGSEKQLLFNDFEQDENDTRTDITFCDKINILDDYIYFIDYSKNGKSRICRIKPDGTELEYISQYGAYGYSIDTQNEKLYYSTGKFGLLQTDAKTIYEVSIATGKETELFKYGSLGQPEFLYYDNYLYFTNQHYYYTGISAEEPGVCGMRYDLNNKTMQTLYGYIETTYVCDEKGFIDKKVGTSNYYWDESTYYSDHY